MIKWIQIRKLRTMRFEIKNVKINEFGRVNIFLCEDKSFLTNYSGVAWVSHILRAISMPVYLRGDRWSCLIPPDRFFPISECNIKTNMFEVSITDYSYIIKTNKHYSACYIYSPELNIPLMGRDAGSLPEYIAKEYSYYVYDAPERIICFENIRGIGPIESSILSKYIGSHSKKQFFISTFDENFITNTITKTPAEELKVFYGPKELNAKQIEEIISSDCFLLNLDKIVSD